MTTTLQIGRVDTLWMVLWASADESRAQPAEWHHESQRCSALVLEASPEPVPNARFETLIETPRLRIGSRRLKRALSLSHYHLEVVDKSTMQQLGDFEIFEETYVIQGNLVRAVRAAPNITARQQGLGLGTEAKFHLLEFLFEQQHHLASVALVKADNHASLALHHKLGYRSFDYHLPGVWALVLTRENYFELKARVAKMGAKRFFAPTQASPRE